MATFGQVTAILDERFATFCTRHHLRLLTSGMDKYGSLVWEAARIADANDPLNRFITFALTETARESDKDMHEYLADIMVGADDGKRYHSETAASWTYPAADDIEKDADSDGLNNRLNSAWKRARRISDSKLDENYIVERPPLKPAGVPWS